MNRSTLAVGSLLFLFLLAGGRTALGLGITPAYVDIALDPKIRSSGEFVVSNTGDTVERYRINAINFVFTKEGSMKRLDAADPAALSSWIVFNPKEVTVDPQTKKTIRFSIVLPKVTPANGEYMAGMEAENLDTTTASSKGPDGRDMKIKMVSTILVPIFAQVGTVTHKGELKEPGLDMFNNQLGFHMVVGNLGTGRLWVEASEFELFDTAGQSVEKGQMGKGYVLKDAKRIFNAPLKANIPDGKYTVKVKISSPQLDNKPLLQEAVVEWKRPVPATAAAGTATTRPSVIPAPAIAPTTSPAASSPASGGE